MRDRNQLYSYSPSFETGVDTILCGPDLFFKVKLVSPIYSLRFFFPVYSLSKGKRLKHNKKRMLQ